MPRATRRTAPYSRLRAFLADRARPDGTLTYHAVQGFLFTIASAPDLVLPSEWMPFIFDDKPAGYRTPGEAKAILGELTALYNAINAAVLERRVALPADCRFKRAVLANLEGAAPVSQWASGFVMGHQWLRESWEPYITDDMDAEFGAVLMALSFFASTEIAQSLMAETGKTDLAEMAGTVRRLFNDALGEYAVLGRLIHEALAAEAAGRTPARGVKKGRNDLCPCGSGKKYKKCHGAPA